MAAIAAYIGTNIDDLFLNMLFFTQAKKKLHIVYLGKYITILLLFGLSTAAALGLQIIPYVYIRWLGLVPIALGIRAVFDRDEEETASRPGTLLWNVILVTLANSADNIGVYIPLFTGYDLWQLAAVLFVFLLMSALWCFLGQKLVELPLLRRFLLTHKRWIVPSVLIILGLSILL